MLLMLLNCYWNVLNSEIFSCKKCTIGRLLIPLALAFILFPYFFVHSYWWWWWWWRWAFCGGGYVLALQIRCWKFFFSAGIFTVIFFKWMKTSLYGFICCSVSKVTDFLLQFSCSLLFCSLNHLLSFATFVVVLEWVMGCFSPASPSLTHTLSVNKMPAISGRTKLGEKSKRGKEVAVETDLLFVLFVLFTYLVLIWFDLIFVSTTNTNTFYHQHTTKLTGH